MRKTLFKWHSMAALVAMLPLLIVSITGAILVFKVEIDTWLMPENMTVNQTVPASDRLAIDTLIATVEQTYPDYVVTGWELFDDGARTDAAYLMKRGTHDWFKVYLNQYSGEVLSEPVTMQHYLTDWLLQLHYAFLLDANGMFVGAVISLLLLFLGISGIVLYRRFWAQFLQFRWRSAMRIWLSDVHKFIGIISSPVLIILAFTGAYWNILMVAHEIDDHVINEPYQIEAPLYDANTLSVQNILNRSRSDLSGFQGTYLLIPFEPDLEFMIFGFVPDSGILASEYSSVLTYAKTDGALLDVLDIREASIGEVIDDSFRKLHFGYFGGMFTKILWAVLGLSPVWLALTGFYMFGIRTRKIAKTSE